MTATPTRRLDPAAGLDSQTTSEPPPHSTRGKRLDIQALRALAVMSVVLYHLWPEHLTGGFTGVDIFFVISGYLMTTTLMREIRPALDAPTQRIRAIGGYFAGFYARRLRRLIPAAAVALLGVLGMVLATGEYVLIGDTASHVVAAALFGENWKLAQDATNYLAPTEAPTAVQHFWSLSIEEQFYAVWPLCLLIVSLVTFAMSAGRRRAVSVSLVLAATLVSFTYGWYLTTVEPPRAYFVTQARMWELIIGGLIFFLPRAANATMRRIVPWLGLTLCLVSIYALNGDHFPGWHALIPTLGTALVIYGGTVPQGREHAPWSFHHVFGWWPIQWIGNISYSLYLWHWPFIVLLPILARVDINGARGLPIKATLILLSLVAAGLSYQLIEQPTRRLKARRTTVLGACVAMIAVVAVGGVVVSRAAANRTVLGINEVRAIAADEQVYCFGARSIEHRDQCGDRYGKINEPWASAVKADYSLSIMGHPAGPCPYYRPGEWDDPTNVCVLGDDKATKQIVVWGDSHSDHWANALHAIGLKRHIRIILLSSAACATEWIALPRCAARIDFIRKQGFLGGSSQALIVAMLTVDVGTTAGTVLRTLRSMTDLPLYLMEDVPVASEQGGPDCYRTRKRCTDDETWALQRTRDNIEALKTASLLTEDHVIRTSDLFCKQGTCYSFIGGAPVYHDTDNKSNSHISSVYSRSLSGLLEKKLEGKGVL